jgi:hypothetical protein
MAQSFLVKLGAHRTYFVTRALYKLHLGTVV